MKELKVKVEMIYYQCESCKTKHSEEEFGTCEECNKEICHACGRGIYGSLRICNKCHKKIPKIVDLTKLTIEDLELLYNSLELNKVETNNIIVLKKKIQKTIAELNYKNERED